MNQDELLRFLIDRGQEWILTRRANYRPSARALTASEAAHFSCFFEREVLENARVKRVPFIENPGFYSELDAMGIPPPLDFTSMAGITFVDTILISDRHHPPSDPIESLLFHELVHIVQYSILGVTNFTEEYVQGWAQAEQDYYRIPLERHAFELESRYTRDRNEGFSVGTEVLRRLNIE